MEPGPSDLRLPKLTLVWSTPLLLKLGQEPLCIDLPPAVTIPFALRRPLSAMLHSHRPANLGRALLIWSPQHSQYFQIPNFSDTIPPPPFSTLLPLSHHGQPMTPDPPSTPTADYMEPRGQSPPLPLSDINSPILFDAPVFRSPVMPARETHSSASTPHHV